MCYPQLHLQLWSFPLDDVNQRPVQKIGVESCFLSIEDGLNPPKAEIALGWVHPIIVRVIRISPPIMCEDLGKYRCRPACPHTCSRGPFWEEALVFKGFKSRDAHFRITYKPWRWNNTINYAGVNIGVLSFLPLYCRNTNRTKSTLKQ